MKTLLSVKHLTIWLKGEKSPNPDRNSGEKPWGKTGQKTSQYTKKKEKNSE